MLAISLVWQGSFALPPQDIASGASAFQGQDIMGGAAVIFKRPQRLRDLVGGAGMAIVKKSKPVRHTETTDIARNNANGRRPPRERPPATLSDADKAEAFKNQGNTYYGLGQYEKAVEAYQNALKFAPNDPDTHNNLGATYLNLSKNDEASQSFKKAYRSEAGRSRSLLQSRRRLDGAGKV